jgi:DNA-binding transcriptional ArsR family regulator
MANAERAFSALYDPTRRAVLERLRDGPRPVGEIARGLPVTRPAVSQHLKVLKDAGLVADRSEGTKRIYYIDPKGLGAMRAWLDQFWDSALTAFAAEVERAAGEKKKDK